MPVNVSLLKTTAQNFGADGASTHAAAIAYSAIFAIAPLLIVTIGIAAQVLQVAAGPHQHHVVENQLIAILGTAVGNAPAQSVRGIVDASFAGRQGSTFAQLAGWVAFIIAASGLFLSLQNALNTIWQVEPKGDFWLTVRNRAVSIGLLFVIAAFAVALVAANILISRVPSPLSAAVATPVGGAIAAVVQWLVTIAIAAVLFGLLFKVLPDTEVAWSDVRLGGLVTAVLFVIGEAALGLYVRHAGISNGYGAAGSIVVLLVWVYYSASLLLFGAEFTRTYAQARRT